MGRRYKKKKPAFLTGLVLAPWWVSAFFAVITWMIGRIVVTGFASVPALQGLVPLIETLMIIAVIGFVLISVIAFFIRKARALIGISLSGVKLADGFRKAQGFTGKAADVWAHVPDDVADERREPFIAANSPGPPVYKVREGGLLTKSEINFYRSLERAVGHQYRILSMVRVGDALFPNQTRFSKGWGIALSRVNQKHFDFVLCDWETFELVAAIELDDPTHFKKSRKKRDAFLNKTCEKAGLPLIRFWVGDKNTPESVCETINQAIGSNFKPRPQDLAKHCTRCDAPMLRYRGTSGALAGKRFWRCARYPACREVAPIPEKSAVTAAAGG